jgi:hypothetical protein
MKDATSLLSVISSRVIESEVRTCLVAGNFVCTRDSELFQRDVDSDPMFSIDDSGSLQVSPLTLCPTQSCPSKESDSRRALHLSRLKGCQPMPRLGEAELMELLTTYTTLYTVLRFIIGIPSHCGHIADRENQ